MDILSYGTASKADQEENKTRSDILGEGVEGSFSSMKERIDHIEQGIQGVTKQADKLIIQNAVNIMKSHAKLNAVAQSKKYRMYDMIFDDLLDLSGIDIVKSKNYIHDATLGEITAKENCVIETVQEYLDAIPNRILFTLEIIGGSGLYYISRDNGGHWESIQPNTLFYFHDHISPLDNKLKIKMELPAGTKLLNYALTWA